MVDPNQIPQLWLQHLAGPGGKDLFLKQVTAEVSKLVMAEASKDLSDPIRAQQQRGEAAVAAIEARQRAAQTAGDAAVTQAHEAQQSVAKAVAETLAKVKEDADKHGQFLFEEKEKFAQKLMKEVARIEDMQVYWSKQETNHRFAAVVSGLLLTVLLGGLFSAAVAAAPHLQIDTEHIGVAVSVVACGLISMWAIGILSRVYLSSLFSLKDARHRLAAIHTFVGMRFRGQLDENAGRALFRFLLTPSPTGLLRGAEVHPLLRVLGDGARKATKTKDEAEST